MKPLFGRRPLASLGSRAPARRGRRSPMRGCGSPGVPPTRTATRRRAAPAAVHPVAGGPSSSPPPGESIGEPPLDPPSRRSRRRLRRILAHRPARQPESVKTRRTTAGSASSPSPASGPHTADTRGHRPRMPVAGVPVRSAGHARPHRHAGTAQPHPKPQLPLRPCSVRYDGATHSAALGGFPYSHPATGHGSSLRVSPPFCSSWSPR
jgi:hypothetical protein